MPNYSDSKNKVQSFIVLGMFSRKAFFKAISWCICICVTIFFPYLFAAYVGNFITQVTGSGVNEVGEWDIFKSLITEDLLNKRFIFIPISIASAAYIGYLFESSVKLVETMVHLGFVLLLLMVSGQFICVYITMDVVDNGQVLTIHESNIQSVFRLYFIFSMLYAIAVKYLLIISRS